MHFCAALIAIIIIPDSENAVIDFQGLNEMDRYIIGK